jgi:hypothetical protein
MIKLKTILNEGFAWERKEGKGLPTMAEVKAEYDAKQLRESYDSMSDSQLIAAAQDEGMEEMIIMGYDGELINRAEIIDLLNADSEYADDEVDDDGYPVMDGGRPSGSSREVDEAVGQEDADTRWNDPIQMGMRDISKPTTTSSIKAPSNFYREKLVSLKAQRKQIEFDMEQEAEPEGGPVADYYGDALQHVDGQIDMIMQKIRTNESMNEGFISRLKKNLIGAELRK